MLTATSTARLPSGITLPYLEQGSRGAVPVLFLHGLTDSCRSFEPVLARLPNALHAIAPSQRGHGGASLCDRYRLEDFATDVAALMDQLGLDRAVIVGHSMGASVAQRFALDHPERVLGLVLIGALVALRRNRDLVAFGDTTVMPLVDPVDPVIARAFQESTLARPIPDDMLDLFVQETLKVPASVWKGAWSGLAEADPTAELSRIDAPTLLIWGDRDTIATKSEQDLLLRSIPGSRSVPISGGGHAVHWEEPERIATLIADFASATASDARRAPSAAA